MSCTWKSGGVSPTSIPSSVVGNPSGITRSQAGTEAALSPSPPLQATATTDRTDSDGTRTVRMEPSESSAPDTWVTDP